MKIGILTQPLRTNYGGLIQAWALQKVLTEAGHQCIIVNREFTRLKDLNLPHRIAASLKTELYILLGRERRRIKLSDSQTAQIRKNTEPFIRGRYRGISPLIYTKKALSKYTAAESFDAYVVGSDQVWRPWMSPAIGNYFLDFLPKNSTARRIAYAASFGVDNWEFSDKQTATCRELARKFDFITVRESSGVKLVEDYLKCKATHVLDPTMLLDKEDYLRLVETPTVPLHQSDGKLFCYVLDQKPELQEVIGRAAQETGLKAYFCNASRKALTPDDVEHLDECVFPPVEQWLKSFADAEMVLTDSFHGTVFSIIFNKPFWVVTNKERGESRFISLLRQFGLSNRVIGDAATVDWNEPIDWAAVNAKRQALAGASKELLLSALEQ